MSVAGRAFPLLRLGDRVRFRRGSRFDTGRIVGDKGIMTPAHSNAPLASAWPPEQVWEVEFDLKPGVRDLCGCWESDLELIEPAPRNVAL